MSEGQIVSLVALTGWLILVLAGYRAHRISPSRTIVMLLVWGSIFLAVVLVFSLVI